jgi:hypothetical protein
MSLIKLLDYFVCSINGATSYPPNDYPDWLSYEEHMADLKSYWSQIRPKLKRDLETAAFIDTKLQEMFTAFDAGDKATGVSAACAIYNCEIKKLR